MKKIAVLLFFLVAQQAPAQQVDEDTLKRYHQFDFWLGQWDVYKFGTDDLVGESHIESIIDSVGLLENYKSLKGKYAGKSLNKYNPAKEQWEQYWIDNSGLTLFLNGGMVDSKMTLDDLDTGNEEKGFNKITWEKLDSNRVRQTWSTSVDKGENWAIIFDGEYRRRSSSNQ